MTWRFEPGEPLSDAFRRVAAEEIARIRSGLADDIDHAKAVHQARQGFKRLRALARLGKPALGAAFADENRRWRDAGRLLAGSRDKTVLLESFDRLIAGGPLAEAAGIDALRGAIVANGHGNDRAGNGEDVEGVLTMLDHAEGQVAALTWPKGTAALYRGLRAGQANLKRHFRHARKREAPDDLHTWRKRVKDQAAQLRLLRRVMPKKYGARHRAEKAVGELLGEEHDLWLLSEWLRHKAPRDAEAALRDRLIEEIEARRGALRGRAFKLGEVFSSEKAGAMASAISEAWESASRKRTRRSRRAPARP